MSNYPTCDFTGQCGEAKDHPYSVTSSRGMQPNETVTINGNADLSTCMVSNGNGKVYGITLTGSPGIYDYVLNIDAQGPSGFGSGSMYLAFTDESNDTYYIYIYSSSRSTHTLRYNSNSPAIKTIYWCDKSFTV